MIITIIGSNKEKINKFKDELIMEGHTVFLKDTVNYKSPKAMKAVEDALLDKISLSDKLIIFESNEYETANKLIEKSENGKFLKAALNNDIKVGIIFPSGKRTGYSESFDLINMNTVINSGFIFYINQIIHIFGIAIQRIEGRKGNWTKLRFIKTKFRGFDGPAIDRGYKNLTNYIKNNIEEISSAFDEENESK